MDECTSNKGWPDGTGIRITTSGSRTRSLSELAEALESVGCPAHVSTRAAVCIQQNGFYETRLRTSTVTSRTVHESLEDDGLLLSIEDRAPEGNDDHATDTEYERHTRYLERYTPAWSAPEPEPELCGPKP